MPSKSLSDWLEKIGHEMFIVGAHPDGTLVQRTNDEQLARLIWERALGQQIQTEHEDGSVSVNVLKPDAKAQSFIFERREGKFVAPLEDNSLTPLDRIDDMIKDEMNDAAKAAVDGEQDDDNSDTDDDADETVPEDSETVDRSNYESDGSEEFAG